MGPDRYGPPAGRRGLPPACPVPPHRIRAGAGGRPLLVLVLRLAAARVVVVALPLFRPNAHTGLFQLAGLAHARFLGLARQADLLLLLAQQAVFFLAPGALRGLARLGLDLL